MQMRKLGGTGVAIAPLVLGGNVFGWTADRETSFAILDAFLEAGFNAIDTADFYMRHLPGFEGGESETVIGEWLKDRGVRDKVVLITKGGLPMGEGMEGLSRDYLPRACEASLRRLQTDHIDVYMAHQPDVNTPIAETLEAFQALIDAGKVGHAAASNYSAEQLREAVAAEGPGRARYGVLEQHYNLAAREEFEGPLEDLCLAENIGTIPYFSLAGGFLTGKYRSKDDAEGRARGGTVQRYLTPRNFALLDVLDTVAARHDATLAQVSLAWLLTRKSVSAPIVSATSLGQLGDILKSVELKLTAEDLAQLDAASA
ncbi:aldo/keto reductase [Novosphingobium sp. JCM 18896]|uniref:aldo/keto reductase n=1 Tax=Novosphingobium sp. JCM 18896 TaxID=2989731 RepID=UPI00222384D4|nr:aldo/keto reductase [Novosphingobium sp. JCM 18896]MCW1429900.1 aldo/keto reductase [Novosphingobium sp. JCM 18896]